MVWLVLSTQIKIHTYIKWLKTYRPSSGLPKSGLVKHASDNQAENTVVFNASDSVINASQRGFHIYGTTPCCRISRFEPRRLFRNVQKKLLIRVFLHRTLRWCYFG